MLVGWAAALDSPDLGSMEPLPVSFPPPPQKFLFFVLKSSDVLDILVPILYFLNDARADQCKEGWVMTLGWGVHAPLFPAHPFGDLPCF